MIARSEVELSNVRIAYAPAWRSKFRIIIPVAGRMPCLE